MTMTCKVYRHIRQNSGDKVGSVADLALSLWTFKRTMTPSALAWAPSIIIVWLQCRLSKHKTVSNYFMNSIHFIDHIFTNVFKVFKFVCPVSECLSSKHRSLTEIDRRIKTATGRENKNTIKSVDQLTVVVEVRNI